MTRTPASRRAYRRALAENAQEGAKDAPGTPNAPEDEVLCVECHKPVLEDDVSEDRDDLHYYCEAEHRQARADAYSEDAYDRWREDRATEGRNA